MRLIRSRERKSCVLRGLALSNKVEIEIFQGHVFLSVIGQNMLQKGALKILRFNTILVFTVPEVKRQQFSSMWNLWQVIQIYLLCNYFHRWAQGLQFLCFSGLVLLACKTARQRFCVTLIILANHNCQASMVFIFQMNKPSISNFSNTESNIQTSLWRGWIQSTIS